MKQRYGLIRQWMAECHECRHFLSVSFFPIYMAAVLIVIARGEPSFAEQLEVISPSQIQGEVTKDQFHSVRPLVSTSYSGHTPFELNITDAVVQAVDWHPGVGQSVGELRRQQQNIRTARAGYFPQLSLGVIGGYDSETDGDGDGHAVQLYVSQVIYDFGKISGSVGSATASAHASQARVLLQIDTVARDTAQAALEVLRYQTLVRSADAQVEGVSSISDLVRMRNQRGASTRSDVLQAQARIESARANRQQTLAQLSRWRGVLQNLVGVQEPIVLQPGVPGSVVNGCMVDPLKVNTAPSVLVAEADRSQAVAQLKEARAQSWPTLSLDGSVNRYLDQQYVDSNALNDHESAIFLNLSMPIYQGGRIFANRDAANFAMRSAEAAKDAAQLNVSRDLRIAQSQSVGLERSLSILDTRLRAIEETRDLYRKQYSALGTRTLVELLNSEEEVQQARVERANTQYDLYRLNIDCLYTVGEIREAFALQGRTIQGVEILP
ncbi:TolC family outer membrane protein [Microbulbifer agarilyticus]|uniref:TolC family outer membrane protein n=1 Tax=Microbulbifer agarilyticus TaxID=260552 RepID=UPI001CD2D1A7|nr:TolC family outer membrane protein [Microbulbifer agarilyticus]MCA0901187.1 TolC family outer membrane protein [Microbulbifer agarilyticus]